MEMATGNWSTLTIRMAGMSQQYVALQGICEKWNLEEIALRCTTKNLRASIVPVRDMDVSHNHTIRGRGTMCEHFLSMMCLSRSTFAEVPGV